MNDEKNTQQEQQDIWVKGVKTICGHHKKALLDYVDAMNKTSPESLGLIKAKIHNDLSQIQLSIGILFETYKAGGTIKPFEDSFNRGTQKRTYNRQ